MYVTNYFFQEISITDYVNLNIVTIYSTTKIYV